MQQQIAVVGAGVVGLSTAVQIQQLQPSASVTLIADKFTTETTSHGAAGIFRPTVDKILGVPLPQLRAWLRDSWNQYDMMAHSADADAAGIQIISGVALHPTHSPNDILAEIAYQYRPMSDAQLKMFNNNTYKYGWFVTTLLVDPAKYLPYLMNKFKQNGGRIVVKKLSSLEELVGQYDIVINCTGLGSRELIDDTQLVPNRGQLVSVKAPWLKHFIYTGDEGLEYILPGVDMVHIGGTRTDNDTDLTPRPADRERILQHAYRTMPALKNAPIVREWVGLRPTRKPLRIEQELMKFPSGSLQVVHNYGHGANGIGLSWGTAKHAARIANEILTREKHLTSKL